ncbi:MAG TPA: M14 family metallopeptidase [Xanthomonadaceae bacterium]|jgi:hypothetical protein
MPKHPLTRAEASGFTETSRHADVMAFIAGLAARNDPRLHVADFGTSPEGRALPLLVLSAQGHFTPDAAHAAGLPVVLVICGIHAGEVEGKEGGLMLVRDLLDGNVEAAQAITGAANAAYAMSAAAAANVARVMDAAPVMDPASVIEAAFAMGVAPETLIASAAASAHAANTLSATNLLDKLTLVVVPLFNPDGNDRIDPANRALDVEHFKGQLGPDSGVGTRVNAAGVNLNRDYMRQDAPEMRALQTRVCQPWNAHLTIDCHATNGSIHRFAMTYDIPHVVESGRREPIDYMREKMMPAVSAAVKRRDGFDSFWYGNFLRDEGGQGTGWITYTHHPRFGGNYRGLTNRLDLLLEAYSYITFEERVQVTYAFIREALVHVAAHGDEIRALLDACTMPPDRIAVRYRLEPLPGTGVDILTREPYALDGAPIVVPNVPHYARFVGEHVVDRPWGYAVPPEIAKQLEGHGLVVEYPTDSPMLDVEVATITGRGTSEGREILEANASTWLEATYGAERRALPEGWGIVPTEQPRGAMAVYLCEAASDDGAVPCEWFDAPAAGQEHPLLRVRSGMI